VTNPLLDPNSRIVIAHRGNRARAPENTLESLRQAVALGADAIEFDVRVTRDGVPVIIHDPHVDRTTNGRGLVGSFTFKELRSFDASARSPYATAAPLPIPSLEEVLDAFRDTPLVIEVKEVAAVEATERMIRQFGAQNRVLIGSAEALVVERFYRSGLSTCASMRDATRLIPIALAGMKPATPHYHVLSITRRFRGFPIPVLRMAAAARKVGIATQVWTVNDPMVARTLWHGGVSGIVTDDPQAMLRARVA
jgi:glycerophosphoryl diester phosphodiesterase